MSQGGEAAAARVLRVLREQGQADAIGNYFVCHCSLYILW